LNVIIEKIPRQGYMYFPDGKMISYRRIVLPGSFLLLYLLPNDTDHYSMKISYNWLQQYLPLSLDAAALAPLLTDCGLEVEGMETFQSMKGGLEGIVTG